MHGRLKVRSTQEQEERKRLEREKKLKIYKDAMSISLKKLNSNEYDQNGLSISAEILSNSCDITTLWNYRKSTIESLQQKPIDKDEMINTLKNEMSLTEQCLKKNPKSYGTWYHRQWCLLKANHPENKYGETCETLGWKNELKLCTIFLNADERNFHCWKHRLFVITNGELSKKDELEFTYDKICANFSNYSAWHYRSKFIEHLYGHNQIDSEVFKKELDLIENAIFTDPNDQSAWIYEKWLLQEHKRSLNYKDLIENHLNNVIELLKLESDKSKWCMLTLVELMGMVNYEKYKEHIFLYLDKLANEIDLYRQNYYIDLKNKMMKLNS